MTELQMNKVRRPIERLSREDWHQCSYEYNKIDWPHSRQYRLWQRRKLHGWKSYMIGRRTVKSGLHPYRRAEKCAHQRFSGTTEDEFNLLADRWELETRNLSSPSAIVGHPAVLEMMELDDDIVPMIIQRMQYRPWFWFDILMRLTKVSDDPIDSSMRGDMQKMTDAWLRWGESRGII
jgi:hypothetical protein